MDLAAKVGDAGALTTRVEAALAAWGAALVEEFVGGREATVLVVQSTQKATALVPVECVFPGPPDPGAFKDFDTKFGSGTLEWRAMDTPQDATLAAALCDAAVKVHTCTHMASQDAFTQPCPGFPCP